MAKKIPQSYRLIWLDGIRGFALLGILLMNIQTFISAQYYYGGTNHLYEVTMLDKIADWVIDLLIVGKFYPIFSILFGISFALFLESMERRGERATIFHRRLLYLALFGLIHIVFIWRGDILLTYALAGFVLMLCRNRSMKFIRNVAIGLFVLANTFIAFMTMAAEFVLKFDATSSDGQTSSIERANQVYQNGSYLEIFRFRLQEEVLITVMNSLISVLIVIPLFLIGYYITKKIRIQQIKEHLDWVRTVWNRSFVVAVIFSILFALAKSGVLSGNEIVSIGLIEWFRPFAGLATAILYMSSFFLLFFHGRLGLQLSIFNYAGRMALTNYLLQSIICGLIFYGYGLGLYGYIGSAFSIVIALMIYVGLSILSFFWLKMFYYGPFEWIWRSLTFRKKQPMRK